MEKKKPRPDLPSLDEVIENPNVLLEEIEKTEGWARQNKREVKIVRLSDGSKIFQCNGLAIMHGPPPDPSYPGQWGHKGGGGGGGGGGHSGGGGGSNQEAHAGNWRPSYRAIGTPGWLRSQPLPEEVAKRPSKALDFGTRKLGGLEIIGGGSGRSPKSKYWKRQRSKSTPTVSSTRGPKRSKQDRKNKRYGRAEQE